MWSPFGPYGTIMAFILVSTIPLRNLLSRDEKSERLKLSELPSEIREKGYKWHISLFVIMYLYKAIIDYHNEPIKPRVGGYTHWIHSIEGDFTFWAQSALKSDLLTDILSFHYLYVYLFTIWFLPIYFILVKDHVMADKATLNYFVIYVLAVPMYLFFNVEVTSSFIPGMEALLYHDSWYLEFFTNNDPMDNGVPSLHFGLPMGLLILNRLHCRDLGISIREWRHRELDTFVIVNVGIYFFSIQYLGIHWITDIVPGLLLGVICAIFCHKWQPILRNRNIKGWKSLIPSRKALSTAIVFTILCGTFMVQATIDGPGTDEDVPNYRIGSGDYIIETIEVHSLSHPVTVEISNLHSRPGLIPPEEKIICVISMRSDVVHLFDRGGFSDEYEFYDLLDLPHHSNHTIASGESAGAVVDTKSIFDTHLVICHSPQFTEEVRITMNYFDDELIWSALLVSLPAFFITGLVINSIMNKSDHVEGEDPAHVDS
ncbi:MAG: hypothetical protein L7R66_01420 [Candidatus Thalassarchaeaceae archaeon]|nr:hypothetical protein [Candidatus Thalassarchaeaceae archaeon]